MDCENDGFLDTSINLDFVSRVLDMWYRTMIAIVLCFFRCDEISDQVFDIGLSIERFLIVSASD